MTNVTPQPFLVQFVARTNIEVSLRDNANLIGVTVADVDNSFNLSLLQVLQMHDDDQAR